MVEPSAQEQVDEPRVAAWETRSDLPLTVGRLVAAGLMLGGIAILGTVTAAIATWFLEQISAPTDPPAVDPAMAELLAAVRALHERLDRLERSRDEALGS